MNTIDFIDEIKKRGLARSDYAVAKLLGTTRSCLSNYRTGRSQLDDETALKVAAVLQLEPGYVLACIHAARAKDPAVMSAWQRAAEACRRGAAAIMIGILIACGFGALPHPADASAKNVYYVKSRRRRSCAGWATWWAAWALAGWLSMALPFIVF